MHCLPFIRDQVTWKTGPEENPIHSFPQRHPTVNSGRSQSLPKPDGIHVPPSVCLTVFYQNMNGKTPKGATQRDSRSGALTTLSDCFLIKICSGSTLNSPLIGKHLTPSLRVSPATIQMKLIWDTFIWKVILSIMIHMSWPWKVEK